MQDKVFRRKNHYVPSLYLKRWTAPGGGLWTYRILVSHANVPLWKQNHPSSVAYHTHLYTQVVGGRETDEFERWLDSEFEEPVQETIQKVEAGVRLTPNDWKRLIRFVAAQDVRTPARLEEETKRWLQTLPYMMEATLQDSVRKWEKTVRTGEEMSQSPQISDGGLPLRIFIEDNESDDKMARIGAELVVGRKLWLWTIKRALTYTAQVLYKHKWTIMLPPQGMNWFTSDSPVVRLNFFNPSCYDFRGGWNSPGTEIIMPLSSQHLLYTKIGKRPPLLRGERMSVRQAELIRRIIAEHAHRLIFSVDRDPDIPRLRPRVVDPETFKHEREQWLSWHRQQSQAEKELNGEAEDQ